MSLDACNSGASSDRRGPISLHQAVYWLWIFTRQHPFIDDDFWLIIAVESHSKALANMHKRPTLETYGRGMWTVRDVDPPMLLFRTLEKESLKFLLHCEQTNCEENSTSTRLSLQHARASVAPTSTAVNSFDMCQIVTISLFWFPSEATRAGDEKHREKKAHGLRLTLHSQIYLTPTRKHPSKCTDGCLALIQATVIVLNTLYRQGSSTFTHKSSASHYRLDRSVECVRSSLAAIAQYPGNVWCWPTSCLAENRELCTLSHNSPRAIGWREDGRSHCQPGKNGIKGEKEHVFRDNIWLSSIKTCGRDSTDLGWGVGRKTGLDLQLAHSFFFFFLTTGCFLILIIRGLQPSNTRSLFAQIAVATLVKCKRAEKSTKLENDRANRFKFPFPYKRSKQLYKM